MAAHEEAEVAQTTSGISGGSGKPSTDSFGDNLNELWNTLPEEAYFQFLKGLAGLTAEESAHLSQYVLKLKQAKKFRVIHAMADATTSAKRNFLISLRQKFQLQEQAQKLNIKKETDGNNSTTLTDHRHHSVNSTGLSKLTEATSSSTELKNEGLIKSRSSNMVVTTEDISKMGKMLGDAHIGDSELRLRLLETSNKQPTKNQTESDSKSAAASINKRERPDSNWELLKHEAAPQQKSKAGGYDNDDLDIAVKSPSQSSDALGPSAASDDDNLLPDTDDNDENPDLNDAPSTKRWTKSQDLALRESVKFHGEKNWKAIAERVPGRNHAQCLQRWRKVLKPGLVKGHWSFEEDQVLEMLVKQSVNNWGQISEQIPGRTPKQCRERWRNHLDPSINKGPYTEQEDQLILQSQERLGNKWSQIALLLPGRTEDSVKIRWKSLKQNPLRASLHNTSAYYRSRPNSVQSNNVAQSTIHHNSSNHPTALANSALSSNSTKPHGGENVSNAFINTTDQLSQLNHSTLNSATMHSMPHLNDPLWNGTVSYSNSTVNGVPTTDSSVDNSTTDDWNCAGLNSDFHSSHHYNSVNPMDHAIYPHGSVSMMKDPAFVGNSRSDMLHVPTHNLDMYPLSVDISTMPLTDYSNPHLRAPSNEYRNSNGMVLGTNSNNHKLDVLIDEFACHDLIIKSMADELNFDDFE